MAAPSVNPISYIAVRKDMKVLWRAHQKWLKKYYPDSVWWFPGHDRNKNLPASASALTHALERLLKTGRLSRKITSHGLRALFVMMRRSQGIRDEQIAAELHQIGGVGTLQRVYGKCPTAWLTGNPPNFSWTPKKLAWSDMAF